MYQPPHFRETDLHRQHELIRAHPLGLLVTAAHGDLLANSIPFVLDDQGGEGRGVLRGHLARPNAQWRACVEGCDALVVFQGPEHYVSPSWYPTKQETHRVVPTWNYAVVQVRGRALAIEDPAWLHAQIRALTSLMEGKRPEPWAVDDAPAEFLEGQVRGIVGIEIPIDTIEGKWKASQNRNEADRAGVVEGLGSLGTESASAMAAMVARGRTDG